MTTDDYYNATATERDRMVRDARAAIKPPAAHTHRGKPVEFALQGHHEATKPPHAPTHRKPGPAIVPEKFAHLAILREHTNG